MEAACHVRRKGGVTRTKLGTGGGKVAGVVGGGFKGSIILMVWEGIQGWLTWHQKSRHLQPLSLSSYIVLRRDNYHGLN